MKNPSIEFKPSGRGKAKCPPDPNYPHGIEIDAAPPGTPTCIVTLPYPAPECGHWVVRCDECLMSIAITAAGRVDDPIRVRVPCRRKAGLN
jgi:hypothetical protein